MSSTTKILFATWVPSRCLAPLYACRKSLTILRDRTIPEIDPEALALSALVWVLGNDDRAQRLLALTGLTGDDLRSGLGDRAVLAAVLDFLCAHEPDLLAAAEHLELEPQVLAHAREALSQ